MKRILFTAAAAAGVIAAVPVLAQNYPYAPAPMAAQQGREINNQLDALRSRVKAGFDQGQLATEEADRLYREISRIQAVAESDRDQNGMLTEHDRTELQGRIDALSSSIHWERAEAVPPPPPPPAAPPPEGRWTLADREQWLAGRIDRGIEEGHLSGSEAARGRGELGAIRSEEARLIERDGGALSEADRSYLSNRIDELNQTLRWEGRNPPAPWMGL